MMSTPSPEKLLDAIFEKIVGPFLRSRDQGRLPDNLAGEAVNVLKASQDFEIRCGDLIRSKHLQHYAPLVESLLHENDRIEKKGRSLICHLDGPRTITLPGHSTKGTLEGRFTLDFCQASDAGLDSKIEQRLQSAIDDLDHQLQDVAGEKILVVAVGPQTRKLLGVHTPIGIDVFGITVSLRFLIAFVHDSRIRLFAVGPQSIEIPLG